MVLPDLLDFCTLLEPAGDDMQDALSIEKLRLQIEKEQGRSITIFETETIEYDRKPMLRITWRAGAKILKMKNLGGLRS